MLVIDGAFIATMDAQRLASILAFWTDNRRTGYFEVEGQSEGTVRSFLLRAKLDGTNVIALANRGQLIVCETPDGVRVDILLPPPSARMVYDAVILTPRQS